ncbi:MAG: asparagine--tRNA ligase [Flavobacteriales bacterium]|nr:MAG: asparagine--tRNA ligase [Flavobacteriales bacterium]
MKRTKIKTLLQSTETGNEICAKGWVRTHRGSKNVSFIALNDGSTIHNIQVVADTEKFGEELLKQITTGAAISASGKLAESQGSGQKVEIQAEKIEILGLADAEKYPLQPKKHSLEFLREIAHLRPRTNTFGAVLRVRHTLAFAIHKYFNDNGFYYIHSPIITGSDAEGAGEMFQVTSFDLESIPKTQNGEIDFKKDFFGKETHLTVSGQLEAELAALALSQVYTFGPTFRAENSNTTRHLAEFWMIEPEIAFADIHDNMDLAENCLKYIVKYVLENCADDLAFLNKRAADEDKQKPQNERQAMELLERLNYVLENKYERITYSEAIEILRNSKPNKKGKFQFPIDDWGADLQSEHERYLVEKHFKKPVIITDYPKEIKAFYMYQNDDGKTVRGMDLLFPGIGEIVGGSQREHRLEQLKKGIKLFNIDEKTVWWYLETRKFGTVPHTGFGLGFERLVQFVTGMSNIRDVIPFPRTPGNAEF